MRNESICRVLYAHVNSNQTYYYLTDGLGSVLAEVKSDGTNAVSYQYDVYGNVVNQQGSLYDERQFAGEQADPTGRYASYTTAPPTTVIATGVSRICSAGTRRRSSPSTTRSASLPGSRLPLIPSSNEAWAPLIVYMRIAVVRSTRSSGPQMSPSIVARVRHCCMPNSGRWSVTGASELPAGRTPSPIRLRAGNIVSARWRP